MTATDPMRQLAEMLKEKNKNAPLWGVSLIVTTDWHQVKWRQRYTARADTAADALQFVLCEHIADVPPLAALDNLASHVEPLCART